MLLRKKLFYKIISELGLYDGGSFKLYADSKNLQSRVTGIERYCDYIRIVDHKINLLLNHLGLEYQEKCSEQLPKLVKKGKGKK